MKRLAILVATSFLAVCLTACGEHKKEETMQTPTEATQAMQAAPVEKQAEPAQTPAEAQQ